MTEKEILNKLLPENLYSDNNSSYFQKWLSVLANQIQKAKTYLEKIRANLFFRTMEEDWGVMDWEELLRLPSLDLSLQDRIGRIRAKLAGTQDTAYDIKSVILGYIPTITVDDIYLIPRKDETPSSDIQNNYTYDIIIVADPSLITFDESILREDIERIHPIHCILGNISVGLAWFSWGISGLGWGQGIWKPKSI